MKISSMTTIFFRIVKFIIKPITIIQAEEMWMRYVGERMAR